MFSEKNAVVATLAATFVMSVIGLVAAWVFRTYVFKMDTGDEKMRRISDAIREGGEAFLRRQNTTIFVLAIVFAGLIYGFYTWRGMSSEALKITIAFLVGATCSGLAGYIGMYVSLRSNIRTASAARSSLNTALKVALRGGAVSGMCVVAMSLLGVLGLFLAFGGADLLDESKFQLMITGANGLEASKDAIHRVSEIANTIVGFGFGASFVALFAQLGGGIYTKAADVGADLVGKVEAGIPEDDPRNPAVIADLVGDNVGDCAGRGADLFESTAAENVGAIILAATLVQWNPTMGVKAVFFPLLARAFGILASIVGVFIVSMKSEDEDPMHALNRGYLVTTIGAVVGFFAAVWLLLGGNMWFFAAGLIGIATSFAFVWITQYYTEYKYRPVQSIADACKTGPATNIITGFAVALECTAAPVVVISIAIMTSYWCGSHTPHGGLFGTAVATMGMLSTAGYILAMDTFGPITDNAGGIIEMSEQPEEIRKKTDRLDAVGNTTKALTKGYAIGSAALAAFLLFSAYLDEATTIVHNKWSALGAAETVQADTWANAGGFDSVNIGKVPVFVGGLLGAALCFLFASFAIKAVGRAAFYVIEEVRRQFREKPGIMAGTDKPDYATCVDIVTRGALRSMIVPGMIAVAVPVLVGYGFGFLPTSLDIRRVGEVSPPFSTLGIESVAGLLMVGTIAGILLATVLNNGGGAWDNAKKYIETGVHGGKRSEAHKAAVVGDTVGDPFKDTAGPSLHVLIKLLATITLVFVPLFVH
jgi:K(+)-stimulated pyrophosphate-energized sodium pump